MVFWLFDLSGFIKALVRNILSGCGLAQNRDVQGEVVLVTYIKPITSFLVKRAQLENTDVVSSWFDLNEFIKALVGQAYTVRLWSGSNPQCRDSVNPGRCSSCFGREGYLSP